MGKTKYVVEYARSGRAQCKGPCKGIIEKAELRFGTIVPARNFDGEITTWKHFPRCMGSSRTTPAKEVSKAIAKYGSADAVPGLEFLDEEDRAYAVEALQALAEGREPPPPPDDEDPDDLGVLSDAAPSGTAASSNRKARKQEPGEGPSTPQEGHPQGLEEPGPSKRPRRKAAPGRGSLREEEPGGESPDADAGRSGSKRRRGGDEGEAACSREQQQPHADGDAAAAHSGREGKGGREADPPDGGPSQQGRKVPASFALLAAAGAAPKPQGSRKQAAWPRQQQQQQHQQYEDCDAAAVADHSGRKGKGVGETDPGPTDGGLPRQGRKVPASFALKAAAGAAPKPQGGRKLPPWLKGQWR